MRPESLTRRRFLSRGGNLSLALLAASCRGPGFPPGGSARLPEAGARPAAEEGRSPAEIAREDEAVTLFLAGDVMTGRGLDQRLPHSVPAELHEPFVKDAGRYVDLAEEESGSIPDEISYEYVWGDALEEMERVDPAHRIVNLETALTAGGEPWPGKGIHYRMHPANAPILETAGIDACTLANNHVLDWGYEGLEATLETLEELGIASPGAGPDRESARAPAVLEREDPGTPGRTLVFAFALPDAGVPPRWDASEGRPGVALLPDLSDETAGRISERVDAWRREGDVVIVSLHWGANWGYAVPDEQRRFARRLIEEGVADVIHGHSSHHPKGIEIHRERLILYGCGDLLNDYEGIGGHEELRPELALLYFPTLEPSGALRELVMTPVRVRRFRLERAPGEASRWLSERLGRESEAFGTRVEAGDDGRLLAMAA